MSDYLSALPADLLHHLAQVGWLTDRDVVAFATTSHANFQTIGSRYERASEHQWFVYFLDDVKLHFQMPGLLAWATHEHEPSQPLLFAPTHPKSVAPSVEVKVSASKSSKHPTTPLHSSNLVVILNHNIEAGLKKGWSSLPWTSFIHKEYQSTPHQIGHIIHLRLFAPPVPKPGSLMDYFPRNDEKAVRIPDLSFVPLKTIKHLVLEDSLVHGVEIISSPSDPMAASIFPAKLQSLKLCGATPALFTAELMEHWPISLTSLVLKPDFNSVIYQNSWEDFKRVHYEPQRIFFPNHLQTLSLDNDSFSYEPHLVRIPDSLTELWCTPNHPLKNWQLPHTLEKFIFVANRRYADLVDGWKLPSELQVLEFTNQFIDPIDKIVFNSKLTRLALGGCNHPLVDVSFPASLTELILGNQFQHTLLGVALPPQLKLLKYGTYLDPYIRDPKYFSSLPISLTTLTLGFLTSEAYQAELLASPQMSLQVNRLVNLDFLRLPLHLFMFIEQLPPTVQFLKVGCHSLFDFKMKDVNIFTLNRIFASATSLKRLTFDSATTSLDGLILPPTLEQLEFGSCIVASLQHVHFGSHLQELCFDHDCSFDQTFEGVQLPSTLRRLKFGYVFNQSMERVILPDGLESLRFGRSFNQSLIHVRLPTHLKSLSLSSEYDSSLDGVNLPQGLEVFELSEKDDFSKFTHLDSLIHLTLPSNLRTVCLPHPLQKSYQAHPSRPAYQTWMNSLAHSHPYLQLQLTTLNDPHEVGQYHQEEEEEEEEAEEEEAEEEDDG